MHLDDLDFWRALLRPPNMVQAERAVHAVDAIVFPRISQRAEPVEALSAAPADMLHDHRL